MSFKFSASDFEVDTGALTPFGMAERAQAKLEEWLSTGVRVYGSEFETYTKGKKAFGWAEKLDDATHTALLINIKPLEVKCTEHEPVKVYKPGFDKDHEITYYECRKCNRKLKAKWEIAE